MGLVDDDRVVAAQEPITADLGEQNAVRHDLQPREVLHAIGEADGVPDGLADRGPEF